MWISWLMKNCFFAKLSIITPVGVWCVFPLHDLVSIAWLCMFYERPKNTFSRLLTLWQEIEFSREPKIPKIPRLKTDGKLTLTYIFSFIRGPLCHLDPFSTLVKKLLPLYYHFATVPIYNKHALLFTKLYKKIGKTQKRTLRIVLNERTYKYILLIQGCV